MKKIPDPKKLRRVEGPRFTAAQLKAAKIRITTSVDPKVLKALRKLAQDSGSKYQTLLNRILREYLFDERNHLLSRLERLEKAVFERDAA